jgi:cytochrome P450
MMRLALEIVGQALFSIDLRRDAQALTHATLTALDHIVYRSSHFLALPDGVPTPRNRRFRAALRSLDQAVYALIDQRRRDVDPPDDLLTLLLTARDEETDATLTERQVRDEIMTMLIAGHETVASALTWCWFLLSQHPEVAQAAQAEIGAVLGDRPPTVDDLPQLGWPARIFSETLRLYPPAWLITRQAQAADELAGQPVPAGSLIIISPYVVHRHPGCWEQPENFDPGRFAPDRVDAIERFAYIPFGGGPRLCIGDRFATLEAQLIIAQVLQRYQLELAPGHPVELAPLVTLRPKQGLLMELRRNSLRNQAPNHGILKG